jgi:hypothetical protein
VGDRGARGLVAGEHQHVEEVPELVVTQPVAGVLRLDELGDEVVLRGAPGASNIRSPYSNRAWLAGLANGSRRSGGVSERVGRQRRTVAGALDEIVRELDEEVGVLDGHTEDGQDHPDRQGRGHELDPVATAALDEVVEQLAAMDRVSVLPAADRVRCERLGHEAPEPRVIGGVGVDDRPARLERVGLEVPEVGVADARREHLRCHRHRLRTSPWRVAAQNPLSTHRDATPAPVLRAARRTIVRDARAYSAGTGDVDGCSCLCSCGPPQQCARRSARAPSR